MMRARERGRPADRALVQHAYPPAARRVAAVGALAAAAALVLSLPDLRYLRTSPGPVAVRLSSSAGAPSRGVAVDLVDLDGRPVTRAPATTDGFGVAVVDIVAGRGTPAFLATASDAGRCQSAAPLGHPGRLRARPRQTPASLPVACPPDGAAVLPYHAHDGSSPIVAGPWPLAPWMIELRLRVRFQGTPSRASVAVASPDTATAYPREQRGGMSSWLIRPTETSPGPPRELTLLVTAPGQKPVRLNLGPLSYQRRDATDVADLETELTFEPDFVPSVRQVARLPANPGEAGAFQLTVSNPLDRDVLITRVVVEARQPRPPLVNCSGGPANYDVSLTIAGEALAPDGGEARRFVFPVTGALSQFCRATEMQAAIAFDHPIAAKQDAVLRLVVHEGLKRNRGRVSTLGPVLNDREYDWTFRFEIDRDLVVTGDFHPPRALFGR
jgi:hypothetical protein